MRYALGPMLGSNPVGLFGPMTGRAFGHIGFLIFYVGQIQSVILVYRCLPQENLSLGHTSCSCQNIISNLNKLLEDSKESTSFIIRNRSTRGRHRLIQFDRSKKEPKSDLGFCAIIQFFHFLLLFFYVSY